MNSTVIRTTKKLQNGQMQVTIPKNFIDQHNISEGEPLLLSVIRDELKEINNKKKLNWVEDFIEK